MKGNIMAERKMIKRQVTVYILYITLKYNVETQPSKNTDELKYSRRVKNKTNILETRIHFAINIYLVGEYF